MRDRRVMREHTIAGFLWKQEIYRVASTRRQPVYSGTLKYNPLSISLYWSGCPSKHRRISKQV